MEIFRGYRKLSAEAQGASIALGNFDGVHRGHQTVLAAAQARSGPDCAFGVATFEPHPRVFFAPDLPPFRLTPEPAKLHKFERLGVKRAYILPFDAQIAGMSAEAFARIVLKNGLGVRHVAVGSDFQFGKNRTGDAAMLQKFGAVYDFDVTVAPHAAEGGAAFSSSAAREALRQGDPVAAARILGEAHRIEAIVQKGDQRGRTIGFPTLNLPLDGVLIPRFGVYAVRVDTPEGVFPGVANLGMRPTFEKETPILEAHLFDYSGDLYGAEISVALIGFIRPEQKFDGIDALKAQIVADAETARALLAPAAM